MSEFNGELNAVLFNLASGVVALLGSYAVYYLKKGIEQIRAETQEIQNDDQRKLLDVALSRLDDVATKTVNKIEQTTAKTLRAAIKADNGDTQALKELATLAKMEIEQTLEPVYLNFLKETLGDCDTYIKNVIETKVVQVKGASQ